MTNIIIPMNSFDENITSEKGFLEFFLKIREGGADGVELRRELMSRTINLTEIGQQLQDLKLACFYSAPVPIWKEDSSLNNADLIQVFSEAKSLGAKLVKVNLGSFKRGISNLDALNNVLSVPFQLTVENDQTNEGGLLKNMHDFLQDARKCGTAIKMTFDLGNWEVTGQNAKNAYRKLKKEVAYLHLKNVVEENGKWSSVAIQADEWWPEMMSGIPAAPEFPFHSFSEMNDSINLLRKAGKKHVFY
ncbi:sugar phosphate isomerase/epimerase family protein [Metabacillus sp. RGM 3146]|uniref:sugar phosphate isomerase/epimerase family protein n=1 Tax=Metabacillus sp. RGM 3146 TaxID=3401092 RepID=UPI003B9C311B